jgi:choline-glycine betaine transporter
MNQKGNQKGELAQLPEILNSGVVLASFGFLAFSVMLALSRYGRIRLGGQD